MNGNALAKVPVLALGSPSVPSWSPFARSHRFPPLWSSVGRGGTGSGASSRLPAPSIREGRRSGERTGGRRPTAPNGAAHNPVAANGTIRRALLREENIARAGVLSAGWRWDAGSFTEHRSLWCR